MNSAETLIYFELKYCERCGGLWLRPCAATAVYCSPCARQMAEVARQPLRHAAPGSRAAIALIAAALLPALRPWLELAWECAA
jgi:hypothetical protein